MLRTKRKTIMLTTVELEAMEKAATAAGLSVTSWLRMLGMRQVQNAKEQVRRVY